MSVSRMGPAYKVLSSKIGLGIEVQLVLGVNIVYDMV